MSICEEMSVEYKSRYKFDFLPFHNPIDIDFWLPKVKKEYCTEKQFTILYAGRIGNGVKESISDIAMAVRILVNEGLDIVFEIQTSDIEELNELIVFDNIVRSCPPINYALLPNRFSTADLLMLPQDFDEASVKFLKYSFPTKVSEYMISGTPIVVYGTLESAIVKYAMKEKWGYVVSVKCIESLVNALRKLYSDTMLRKSLGELAQCIAIENEDCIKVREKFKVALALEN
jgi:glycosyltransferase involved in cell wall biosynthesis